MFLLTILKFSSFLNPYNYYISFLLQILYCRRVLPVISLFELYQWSFWGVILYYIQCIGKIFSICRQFYHIGYYKVGDIYCCDLQYEMFHICLKFFRYISVTHSVCPWYAQYSFSDFWHDFSVSPQLSTIQLYGKYRTF